MTVNSFNNDEIDLFSFFKSIKRNTRQLILFSTVSTVIIFSYLLSKPQVWRGSFNILVKSSNEINDPQDLGSLNFLNLNFNKNGNETQKIILQSPLVLKPVFEYIVDYKKKKNELDNSFTFKSWISTLSIEFESNSNVLNISHDNSDKELLINTLKLISSKYKEYSKRDQIQSILNTKEYLESQRQVMSEKSALSQSNFNKFAIENRLGNFDGLIIKKDFQQDSNDASFEEQRNKIDEDFGSRYQQQFVFLNELESEYSNLSKYLKPNSQTLKKLQQEIAYLEKSLERPNKIFLKYNELANEALRDSILLTKIENNLELTKLEQIKTPNPWQLISTPKVDREPVSPSQEKKLFTAFVLSILLGSFFVILKEKLTGLIFNKDEIESSLDSQYLQTLQKRDDDLSVKLILNFFNQNSISKSEISLGIINFKYKSDLSGLKSKLSNHPNIFVLDFLDKKIDTVEKLIIINEEGKLSHRDINSLNQYISIYKKKIIGWLYLSD
tara:strand:- start:747 stop:2243 length:1497 start_codon:yes stop_codon:yes gene_type:complete